MPELRIALGEPRQSIRSLGAVALLVTSLAVLVAASQAAADAASDNAIPAASTEPSSPPTVPAVALSGPFGRLDGVSGPADASWPEPGTLHPLDAHGRGARLVAQPRDLDLGLLDWRLTARSALDAGASAPIELGRGPVGGSGDAYAVVDVPPTGSWMVRLDAGTGSATPASWFWRVEVPDAVAPPPGEPFPPVPRIQLSADGTAVEMVLGAGCFVGTCSDIAAPPAVDELPVLRAGAEASPLTLGLSDGTGIATLNLTATPASGGTATPLAASLAAGPGQPLVTIDAPGSGRWLLEADVTFDLERGAYAAYAMLEVP